MNLSDIYAEWRAVSEEMLADGFSGSVDCGEAVVREDFSAYAGLPQTIKFEDMLKLERDFSLTVECK